MLVGLLAVVAVSGAVILAARAIRSGGPLERTGSLAVSGMSRDELVKAVARALDKIRLRSVASMADERIVRARFGASICGFGEDLSITVEPSDTDPNDLVLLVKSSSAIALTVIDYGKNTRNVHRVIRAIEAECGLTPR